MAKRALVNVKARFGEDFVLSQLRILRVPLAGDSGSWYRGDAGFRAAELFGRKP